MFEKIILVHVFCCLSLFMRSSLNLKENWADAVEMIHAIFVAIHCDNKQYITLSQSTWEVDHRINWINEKI